MRLWKQVERLGTNHDTMGPSPIHSSWILSRSFLEALGVLILCVFMYNGHSSCTSPIIMLAFQKALGYTPLVLVLATIEVLNTTKR